jgi:alkylation response protein AidB-like acyl-CoA dehydrogenase
MDFEDTPEQARYRTEVNRFLAEHWPLRPKGSRPSPYVNIDDPVAVAQAKVWQACKYENGWACLEWPAEYGGRGASAIEAIIFEQEERRYVTPAVGLFLIAHGMLGPTIMRHGTDVQKARFLKPMADGTDIWCQLFSEPSGGSDLAAARMSARRDGPDWVLNGQKIWTSAAQIGSYAVCVTRTDPDSVKHKGLTCFIVDLKAPGVTVRPIRQMDGSADFNEVFLDDVRLHDDARLGEEGAGWQVVLTCLMNERAALSAGLWTLDVEDFVKLARRIRIANAPAIHDRSIAHRIADLHVKLRGIERTRLRAISALSKGKDPGPEASISKLVLGKLGQDIAALALEMQGMAGLAHTPDLDFQLAYLRSPSLRLAGGTDEILRNVISERVLGMPR